MLTESFPYSDALEDTFIIPEIEILSKYFNIILLPKQCNGTPFKIPDNVIINLEYAKQSFKQKFFGAFISLRFKTLFFLIVELLKTFNIKRSKRIIYTYLNANNLLYFLKKQNLEMDLIYSYWFNEGVIGAIFFKIMYNNLLKIITRTHGYDCYLERQEGFIPFREFSLNKIDNVIFVSEAAKKYYDNIFPQFNNKYVVHRLGLKSIEKFMRKKSNDESVRIVSCSDIIKLKRVDKIAEFLIEYSKENKSKNILWTHFGDGPDMFKVIEILKTIPTNFHYILKGKVTNKVLMDYYRTNGVDIFLHFSETEGGCPMAIGEAMSFGIPVLAIDSGGVGELVNQFNGALLNETFTYNDVSNGINNILNMNEEKGNRAFKTVLDIYNASSNHEKFAEFINAII